MTEKRTISKLNSEKIEMTITTTNKIVMTKKELLRKKESLENSLKEINDMLKLLGE